ncbi:MAG: 3-hydroxyacyl-CoA dehydrogenase family protein [Planctomycetota bacterium]|jgi:3-hydroxyacyl-CoA dehydrogenase
MKIENVLVLGASGTLGSLAGGLLAQNGLKVWFLSRTLAGSQKGLARAQKQARSEVIAANITCGDYDTLLAEACGQADWILECVAEDLQIKQTLYEQVDHYRRPDSVVSSVTSSLVLEDLPQGRSESFQSNFLSTHFYNPPARMTACEVSGTSKTNPDIVAFMAEFCQTKLRRAVIGVKPTAGFAGNRLAFLLFARITELAIEHGVEMMDYLIGPYTGRLMPPLATLDLVGLDIHKAIIHSLQDHTTGALHDRIVLPGYVEKMIAAGHLGNKTGGKGGFYKKLESGKFTYFEILAAKGAEANIVHEIQATYIAYAYMLIGEVTEENQGITGIDRVMETGFHWASPSLLVHMLGGKEQAIQLIESQDLPVPDALRTDTTCDKYVFNAGKFFPAK